MSGGTALSRLRANKTAGATSSSAAQGPALPGAVPANLESAEEKCEMCGKVIVEMHSHVVHLENRSLMCTCRPCALLFTERGAGRGRYRAVPNRYLRDETLQMTEAHWDALRIPVRMAFFFQNSELGTTLAFYPSPAGATESLLPMEAWLEGVGSSPLAAELEPDVEALLVSQTRGVSEILLVPIDVCYELVGLVKMYWRGFDGGSDVWERIDSFFTTLRDRSRTLTPESD